MVRDQSYKAAMAARRSPPQTLADLANVGPATLGDFRVLGIRTLAQLARQDAFGLYERLCRKTGTRHDPCCIDVFLSAIDQARTGLAFGTRVRLKPPTPARSRIMAAIRGHDTTPERLVRSALHRHGLRFRLHVRGMPGAGEAGGGGGATVRRVGGAERWTDLSLRGL